ncbi:MAG TPA: type IV toxin-antitoxin system AbiEi family antitoxin [Thermodesulfovibrionales bacterium]|nr:type IV toxin-antitoxin system AbiEi family antitoxin [Thermodesulfovibrionales bacterium]
MGTETKTKINRLINQWIACTAGATSYLDASGFSRDLLVKYKNSGWLEPFGRGAYIRAGDRVTWLGALYTLQKQLGLPVHAGGKTALELKGYAHYLPVRQNKVFLYGPRGLTLPAWFKADRFGVKFVITRTNLFPADYLEGFIDFSERDFLVRIAAPERAAMEMLHLVPKEVGFDEAQLIMENLVALRSDVVQRLLMVCRSVKVKRLFLYMAEKKEHTWLSKLDLSKVDLGKGKRMIVPHGRFNAKYQITVPTNC